LNRDIWAAGQNYRRDVWWKINVILEQSFRTLKLYFHVWYLMTRLFCVRSWSWYIVHLHERLVSSWVWNWLVSWLWTKGPLKFLYPFPWYFFSPNLKFKMEAWWNMSKDADLNFMDAISICAEVLLIINDFPPLLWSYNLGKLGDRWITKILSMGWIGALMWLVQEVAASWYIGKSPFLKIMCGLGRWNSCA